MDCPVVEKMFEFFEVLALATAALAALMPFESSNIGIVPSTEYVTYIPGNINLIISMPHDGYLKPDNIANRSKGCRVNGECDYDASLDNCEQICNAVTYSDKNTQKIGRSTANHFQQLTGTSPHLIISNLHRSKLDPNRPILSETKGNEAAQGDPIAEIAYNDFHETIKRVRSSLKGPGLLIDLHGQTHKQNSSELGYLWKPEELNARDYSRQSSISSLMARKKYSPEEVTYGRMSLGYLFEAAGYKAIPSPRQEIPGDDKYYRGGYITQEWGSDEDGGLIDAIQIEVPSEIRYEGGKSLREQFSKALASILNTFFINNY